MMGYDARLVQLTYTDRERLRKAARFRLRFLAARRRWLRLPDGGESYFLANALNKLRWAENEE